MGTFVPTPAFTPSPYIPLQAVTSTPICTMEVNSSSWRIKKFRKARYHFFEEVQGNFLNYGL
jgi:hypothetical protein